MHPVPRNPLLAEFYHQYLIDRKANLFLRRVAKQYTVGTLERLANFPERLVRRAAVLAIGQIGDFASNQALGRALVDADRGVRLIADTGIRLVWCRWGTASHRRRLSTVMRMNAAERHADAARLASQLIDTAGDMAEAWSQRALAYFHLGRLRESILDCEQTLALNPYHFVAAAGMAQCHLRLGDRYAALDGFRWAIRLNPDLETARVHVVHLERTLRKRH